MLPGALEDRLRSQHVLAQGRVLAAVAIRLEAELARLPNLSPEAADVYVAAAVPTVAAGQRRAATLAAGFARALAPTVDRSRPLELELETVAVTADTAWIHSPIIVGRRELGAGATWAAAIALAAVKAKGYASGDLAVAQRHGLERGARSTGARVAGYRKALAGGACAWCRDVAGTLYALPSNVPFHEHDACSVVPVFD